jgi:hypothetical protein
MTRCGDNLDRVPEHRAWLVRGKKADDPERLPAWPKLKFDAERGVRQAGRRTRPQNRGETSPDMSEAMLRLAKALEQRLRRQV